MSRGALDWSRVADGNATHYDPVYGNFLLQGIGHSLVWHNGRGWARHGGQYPDDLSQLSALVKREAKPAAWTGEGLPPVGTVCELADRVLLASMHEAKWFDAGTRVEVAGHAKFDGADGCVCVIGVEDSSCGFTFTGTIVEHHLRPIRTPEQIAAEEREKAVAEMKRIWTEADTHPFHALYDAGLRFQGGAQ